MSSKKHTTEDSKKNIPSIDHFKKDKSKSESKDKEEKSEAPVEEESPVGQSVADIVNKNLRNSLNSK